MIHRFRIKAREFLGPNGELINTFNTTFVNNDGVTETTTTDFDQNVFTKNIVLPLTLDIQPFDNSDLIDSWVSDEEKKSINQIKDAEKVKYKADNILGYNINFRFKNLDDNTYNNDNEFVGFNLDEESKKNIFKKSYFRLYFYDGLDSETSNLIFVEDLDVVGKTKTEFKMKDLFLDKGPQIQIERKLFMEGKFFNAKTGKIQTFYNLPKNRNNVVGISEYDKVWKRTPISVVNGGNGRLFKFIREDELGGGTITLSEFIID